MYDRWVEKEQLLKHFYEHGQFPSSQTEDEPSTVTGSEARRPQENPPSRIETPRAVQLNHAYVFLVHVCWILSSLFHLALFRSVKAFFIE